MDLAALSTPPRRTSLPQQVITAPQAAAGCVWAMGEGGALYRLPPYARSAEQVQVQDRFWAGVQGHAFSLGRLRLSWPESHGNGGAPREEDCALVATAERIVISGLFSRQRRSLVTNPGENFLVASTDEFQFVAGHDQSVFALSRYAGQTSFCCFDLQTGTSQRLAIGHGDTAVCGPVLLKQGAEAHPVVWAGSALWIYAGGELTPITLPEGVELWTAPQEGGMRLAPGQSPAVTGAGQLHLAARQFGRPALLRLARGTGGWVATAIAVMDEGTLGASTAGEPLLSSKGRLLACSGAAFRTLVSDTQIATRLPAWAHQGLALYFCQVDYLGLRQWLNSACGNIVAAVSWDVPASAEVQACNGFFATGTAVSSLCVLAERGLRTEFFSWCV